jgi:hypothetical protein
MSLTSGIDRLVPMDKPLRERDLLAAPRKQGRLFGPPASRTVRNIKLRQKEDSFGQGSSAVAAQALILAPANAFQIFEYCRKKDRPF